jgi:alginate O-acetyltransferase complex protein AlgJ
MERSARNDLRVQRPSRIYRKVSASTSTSTSGTARPADLAMIAVFLCGITLPLVGFALGLDANFVVNENRVLKTRPDWSWDRAALAEYPRKFEAYFNDRFGFRKRLIHGLSLAKVLCLGISSTPDVILGKAGWLFFAGAGSEDYYRNTRPFTRAELEAWRQMFQQRHDWLAERGIRYLVLFAPNKETMYSEYIPTSINRVRKRSRLDQLHAYMKAHSSVPMLDLRGPLRRSKAADVVYYRTDTHWNSKGAHVAYEQIINSLSTWFPGMAAQPRSSFKDVACPQKGGLAMMLGLQDELVETETTEIVPVSPRKALRTTAEARMSPTMPGFTGPFAMEIDDPQLPRAVMFHDSFGSALMPFLSEHFRRIAYVWKYALDQDVVEREHPDVVIHELVERNLMGGAIPPFHPTL